MHLGNRCSSLIRIVLQNIREYKKICVHNYPRTAVYFERFSVVFEHSPKASCAKHFWLQKQFFKKMSLNVDPWDFQHLRN